MGAKPFLTQIDLSNLEIRNVLAHLLGTDPTGIEGKFYYNTADHTLHFYNGTAWLILGRLDQITAPTGPVSFNSQRITTLADPSSAQDAATRAYVDTAVSGARDVKDSVRVATAAALPAYTRTGNVITATANGALAAIDGVTLVATDRLLLKDGAAAADNGIYTVTQVGTGGTPYILTRASDADTSGEVTAGLYVWTEEGTANADTGWLLTTNNPITLNTTGLTFTQVSALGQVTAGSGLSKTGSTLDVNVANGLEIAADAVQIEGGGVLTTAHGGTGGATVAAAKTSLGFMARFSADYGDGSTLTYTITHNLGTLDVHVAVYRKSDGVDVSQGVDIVHATTNTVTIAHAVAPTSNQFRAVVIG